MCWDQSERGGKGRFLRFSSLSRVLLSLLRGMGRFSQVSRPTGSFGFSKLTPMHACDSRQMSRICGEGCYVGTYLPEGSYLVLSTEGPTKTSERLAPDTLCVISPLGRRDKIKWYMFQSWKDFTEIVNGMVRRGFDQARKDKVSVWAAIRSA